MIKHDRVVVGPAIDSLRLCVIGNTLTSYPHWDLAGFN